MIRTMYDKTDWLDLCAQSHVKNGKIFRGFKDDFLFDVCFLFLALKFCTVTQASSPGAITPWGGIVLSSGIGVHPKEPCFPQITESLRECIHRERFGLI